MAMKLVPLPSPLGDEPSPSDEPFGWVSAVLDSSVMGRLEKRGLQWGREAGLPWGAPTPLLLLTAFCTLLHRYNPSLQEFPVDVSFGWYLLQPLDPEDDDESLKGKEIPGSVVSGASANVFAKGASSSREVSRENSWSELQDKGSSARIDKIWALPDDDEERTVVNSAANVRLTSGTGLKISLDKGSSSPDRHNSNPLPENSSVTSVSAALAEPKLPKDSGGGGIMRLWRLRGTAGQPSTASQLSGGPGEGVTWRSNKIFKDDTFSDAMSMMSGVTEVSGSGDEEEEDEWEEEPTVRLVVGLGEAGRKKREEQQEEEEEVEDTSRLAMEAEDTGGGGGGGRRCNGNESLNSSRRFSPDRLSITSSQSVLQKEAKEALKGKVGGNDQLTLVDMVSLLGSGLFFAAGEQEDDNEEVDTGTEYETDDDAVSVAESKRSTGSLSVSGSEASRKQRQRRQQLRASLLQQQVQRPGSSKGRVSASLLASPSLGREGGRRRLNRANSFQSDPGKLTVPAGQAVTNDHGRSKIGKEGGVVKAAGHQGGSAPSASPSTDAARCSSVFFKFFAFGIDRDTIEEEGEAIPPCELAVLFVPGASRNAMLVRWRFDRRMHQAASIQRLSRNFCALVARMAGRGDVDKMPLLAVPCLCEEERVELQERLSGQMVLHALQEEENDAAAPLSPATPRGSGSERTLVDLLRRTERENPSLTAVVDGETTVVISHLMRMARRIALRLLLELPPLVPPEAMDGRGDEKGRRKKREVQVVGIAMRRGVHSMAALLGVLLAGRAYVALDPSSPDTSGMEDLADRARPHLVLTDAANLDSVRSLSVQEGRKRKSKKGREVERERKRVGMKLLVVEEVLEGEQEQEVPNKKEEKQLWEVRPRPNSVCCVLLKPHATDDEGKPLCVLLEHKGVLNAVHALRHRLPAFAASSNRPGCVRVAQLSSLSFHAHLLEIFCSLDAGAAICVFSPPYPRLLDSASFAAQLEAFVASYAVSGVFLPPAVACSLSPSSPSLSSLLWIVVLGGDPVPLALIRRWLSLPANSGHLLGRAVVQIFGVTELSGPVACAVHRPGQAPLMQAPLASKSEWAEEEEGLEVVKPLPGVHTFILGPCLDLLPLGAPGQLCVSGLHVAKGYLRCPDLTRTKFVTNPYSSGSHDEKLFLTGVRARWHSDGHLQLLQQQHFRIPNLISGAAGSSSDSHPAGYGTSLVELGGLLIPPYSLSSFFLNLPEVSFCTVFLRAGDTGRPKNYAAVYLLMTNLVAATSQQQQGQVLLTKFMAHFQHQRQLLQQSTTGATNQLAGRQGGGDIPMPSSTGRKTREGLRASHKKSTSAPPVALVLLSSLPLTPSGRLDWARLPLPAPESFLAAARSRLGLKHSTELPVTMSDTGEERELAVKLFSDASLSCSVRDSQPPPARCHHERGPGVDGFRQEETATLFDLGGDTYSALQLAAKVQNALFFRQLAVAQRAADEKRREKEQQKRKAKGTKGATEEVKGSSGRTVDALAPQFYVWGILQEPTVRAVTVAIAGGHVGGQIATQRPIPHWAQDADHTQALALWYQIFPPPIPSAPPLALAPNPPPCFPLSHAQQSTLLSLLLLQEQQLTHENRTQQQHPVLSHAPGTSHVWRLHGPVSTARLEAALRCLVGRHSALRTRIVRCSMLHDQKGRKLSGDKGGLSFLLGGQRGNRDKKAVGLSSSVAAQLLHYSASAKALQEALQEEIEEKEAEGEFRLDVVDLPKGDGTAASQEHAFTQAVNEAASRPFEALVRPKASAEVVSAVDRTSSLLFRAVLIRGAGQLQRVLVLSWSPFVFDCVSSPVFYKELQQAHKGGAAAGAGAKAGGGKGSGGTLPLPPVPSYRDCVLWEREMRARSSSSGSNGAATLCSNLFSSSAEAAGEGKEVEAGTWRGGPESPFDSSAAQSSSSFFLSLSAAAVQQQRGVWHQPHSSRKKSQRKGDGAANPFTQCIRLNLTPAASASLERCASRHSTCPGVVLQACFHALLHLWSGQRRVGVAAEAPRRPILPLQAMVGKLSDPLPVFSDLQSAMSVSNTSGAEAASGHAGGGQAMEGETAREGEEGFHRDGRSCLPHSQPRLKLKQQQGWELKARQQGGGGSCVALERPCSGPKCLAVEVHALHEEDADPADKGSDILVCREARQGEHQQQGRSTEKQMVGEASCHVGRPVPHARTPSASAADTPRASVSVRLHPLVQQVKRGVEAAMLQTTATLKDCVEVTAAAAGGGEPHFPGAYFCFLHAGSSSPPPLLSLNDSLVAQLDEDASSSVPFLPGGYGSTGSSSGGRGVALSSERPRPHTHSVSAMGPWTIALTAQKRSSGEIIGVLQYRADLLPHKLAAAMAAELACIVKDSGEDDNAPLSLSQHSTELVEEAMMGSGGGGDEHALGQPPPRFSCFPKIIGGARGGGVKEALRWHHERAATPRGILVEGAPV